MGKLIFLGVTAFLAVRYIVRGSAKSNAELPAARQPETIEVAKQPQLPPPAK